MLWDAKNIVQLGSRRGREEGGRRAGDAGSCSGVAKASKGSTGTNDAGGRQRGGLITKGATTPDGIDSGQDAAGRGGARGGRFGGDLGRRVGWYNRSAAVDVEEVAAGQWTEVAAAVVVVVLVVVAVLVGGGVG